MSLWGISYGTHLALATIRQHGRYIDRAILAGVEGTDNTLKLPNDTQKLLVEFDRRARASVELSKTIPDLLGLMKSVHERLEKQPEIVELVDPKTQSKISITVGIFDLQFIVSGLLGSNEAQAWLPNFYDAMSKGDFSFLAQQTAQYRKGGTPSLMSVAMDCASGISKNRFTQIQLEKQSAMNADAINASFPEICNAINHAELGEDFRRPVKSGVPVLFISGTLDGRTPVSNAEFVMNGFNNSSHLIIDGAGHSDPLFLSSPKIEEAMTDFMRGKKLPSVINIETSLPFRFQLPAGKTSK